MTVEHDIAGPTRLVFVIADPVFQLKTPQALNARWRDRGMDVVTLPAHVAATRLSEFMPSLRANASVAGAVVTIPHKQAVVEYCDELGPHAALTGAVNAIRRTGEGRLLGETFDGLGFVAGLRTQGIDPQGRRVHMIGAGGAARAIAVALMKAGVESLTVQNRSTAKAAELRALLAGEGFGRVSIDAPKRRTADLIVNATSLGMTPGDDVSFDFGSATPDAVAADVVVSESLTPFLAAAQSCGLAVHAGANMLLGQLSLIEEFLEP